MSFLGSARLQGETSQRQKLRTRQGHVQKGLLCDVSVTHPTEVKEGVKTTAGGAANCVLTRTQKEPTFRGSFSTHQQVHDREKSVTPLNAHRSDQISLSVVSDSLRPHESQHARPPCPKSITPGRAWRKGTAVSLCHFSHLL